MDLNSVERIELNALGGADNITINDLTGSDVKQVAIDLGAVLRRTRRRLRQWQAFTVTTDISVWTVSDRTGQHVTISTLTSVTGMSYD